MNAEDQRKIARDFINKDKWWEMLSRFIDVLRINIFIVDAGGRMVLPPEESKYAGRLLTDPKLGFDLLKDSVVAIDQFDYHGQFLEIENRFHLHNYAIPIKVDDESAVGYMIVGPMIVNKRLSDQDYIELSKSYGLENEDFLDEIKEIRIVSNLMVNSILNLLSEIIRDNMDLSIKEKELDQIKVDRNLLPQDINEIAKEIYSTVRFDELLVTLLDVALKMTDAECGSIMVRDEGKDDLTVKFSRGLDKKWIQKANVKIGSGISGIAVKEKKPFIIDGKKVDKKIKHLLKRPDIKSSLVMPLVSKNRVFGVLNIHSKTEKCKISENLGNLTYLTQLISATI